MYRSEAWIMATKQDYNLEYQQVPAPEVPAPQVPAPQMSTLQGQVVFVNMASAPTTAPPLQNENKRYRVKAGKVTGSLQIFCGCFSVILSMIIMYQSLRFESRLIRDFNGFSSVSYNIPGSNSRSFSYLTWPFWAGLCVSRKWYECFGVPTMCFRSRPMQTGENHILKTMHNNFRIPNGRNLIKKCMAGFSRGNLWIYNSY